MIGGGTLSISILPGHVLKSLLYEVPYGCDNSRAQGIRLATQVADQQRYPVGHQLWAPAECSVQTCCVTMRSLMYISGCQAVQRLQ